MDQTLTAIADQLPAAALMVVFMVFVLRWMDKRDADRDDRQAKHDFDVQAAMDRRDELMRQFWQGQQESNREALERLATGVEKVIITLETHDRKADMAIADLSSRLPATSNRPTTPRTRG